MRVRVEKPWQTVAGEVSLVIGLQCNAMPQQRTERPKKTTRITRGPSKKKRKYLKQSSLHELLFYLNAKYISQLQAFPFIFSVFFLRQTEHKKRILMFMLLGSFLLCWVKIVVVAFLWPFALAFYFIYLFMCSIWSLWLLPEYCLLFQTAKWVDDARNYPHMHLSNVCI